MTFRKGLEEGREIRIGGEMDDRWAKDPAAAVAAPAAPGRRLRSEGPRMLWIWSSWALFVVLTVIALVGILRISAAAAPTWTFDSGEQYTVSLDPADDPAIFTSTAQRTSVECRLFSSTGEELSLLPPPEGQTGTVTVDDTKWHLAFRIGIPEPGFYEVTCDGPGAVFGVGHALNIGAMLLMIALPFVGLAIAVTTTIVVLIKRLIARRAYKRR